MDDFLTALASDAPSPGAGAAGGVALALAAACLEKACAITLKHADLPEVAAARGELSRLRGQAMAGARADGEAFEALLAARGEARQAAQARLAREVDAMLEIAARIEALAGRLAPLIKPVMTGDVAAAKVLAQAAAAVHRRNLSEDDKLVGQS